MILLDWSGLRGTPAATVGDLAPCRICGKPALCREPGHPRTPLHKVCAEAELLQRAAAVTDGTEAGRGQ